MRNDKHLMLAVPTTEEDATGVVWNRLSTVDARSKSRNQVLAIDISRSMSRIVRIR